MTFAAKLFWLALLLAGICLLAQRSHGADTADMVPRAVVIVPSVRTYHCAATATGTNGLESDYSTEAVLVASNRVETVSCAWDAPAGSNAIAFYTLYQGTEAGCYTNSVTTTNTQATIRISPAVPTNLVLTITSVGLTNIAWRDGWKGSWRLLGATNLCVTNPVATSLRLYRGLGRPATPVKRLYLQSRLQ